jgi:hypothetical protein
MFGVWCIPGLTPNGSVSMTVEVQASDSERTTRQVRLDILPATFWEAWGWPLTQLALFLLFVWYLIGITVKPTFRSTARFCFSEEPIQRPLMWKRTERTSLLRSQMTFASMRFIPYSPQTASVGPFTFQATKRNGSGILVLSMPSGGRVQINGDTVEMDQKRKRSRHRLNPNHTISYQMDRTKLGVYRYITSGPCGGIQ